MKAIQVYQPDDLRVIDLVKEGKVDLDHKISHTFPMEKAQEAFDFADSGDPAIRKIVLTMESE